MYLRKDVYFHSRKMSVHKTVHGTPAEQYKRKRITKQRYAVYCLIAEINACLPKKYSITFFTPTMNTTDW
jgi:hypothetical protein